MWCGLLSINIRADFVAGWLVVLRIAKIIGESGQAAHCGDLLVRREGEMRQMRRRRLRARFALHERVAGLVVGDLEAEEVVDGGEGDGIGGHDADAGAGVD